MMYLDDLISALQKARQEQGNLRVIQDHEGTGIYFDTEGADFYADRTRKITQAARTERVLKLY